MADERNQTILIRLMSWISVLIGLLSKEKEIELTDHPIRPLPSWAQRVVPLIGIPALAIVVAGLLNFAGLGGLGPRFLRGVALIGVITAILYVPLGPKRASFASVYAILCLVTITIVASFTLMVLIPAIGWWWSGRLNFTGNAQKFEISTIVGIALFPFFSMYALFAATDEDISKSVDAAWVGRPFLTLLVKPVTIIITLLGVLIGASELLFKIATTPDMPFRQLLPF